MTNNHIIRNNYFTTSTIAEREAGIAFGYLMTSVLIQNNTFENFNLNSLVYGIILYQLVLSDCMGVSTFTDFVISENLLNNSFASTDCIPDSFLQYVDYSISS